MDLDAFVATHSGMWDRLAHLTRQRTLSGPETDELVELYRRTSGHLATLRSTTPDPALVTRLSTLLAQARSRVTGTADPGFRDITRFFTVGFPAALYRERRWWLTTMAAFVLVTALLAWWTATTPSVQSLLGTPEDIRQLVEEDFENYYSEHPAASFAARVWTNNAWLAALCLVSGILLGLPVIYLLVMNAANLAVSAGLMAAAGRLDVFFGLITPHGLLELTAVFVAAGAGLRLGWAVIDPGAMTRSAAIAQRGRAAIGLALGLAVVLLISGVIEAFVTPSGLPTWARIAIGVIAEVIFFAYVWTFGRRAVLAGETGDIGRDVRGDVLPTAA
ncbi:MAG TPA: stage II sporulation protein M [Jiangellaceae bacterium]|nr:stage II sporulation protein M [Jiangellaceae bacterium]